MGRRNRLLSVAAPEPTPQERLKFLNTAIEAIVENDVNKLVSTIPNGVDIKTVYHLRQVKPCKRIVYIRASLLHLSILHKSIGCTKFLLHLGAPKEASESSLGDRPIHTAVRIGCRETLNLLIEYGVRSTSLNRRGDSALHIAATKGDVPSLIILLNEDANPRALNRYGETAYTTALLIGTPSSMACADILKEFEPQI